MLLYFSRIQTICARKHNKASQDNYLTATLAKAGSKTDKINHRACVGRRSLNKSIMGKFHNA